MQIGRIYLKRTFRKTGYLVFNNNHSPHCLGVILDNKSFVAPLVQDLLNQLGITKEELITNYPLVNFTK